MADAMEVRQEPKALPATINDAGTELTQVRSQLKFLEKRESMLVGLLKGWVPAETAEGNGFAGELEGVRHLRYPQKSTKYKEAIEWIVDNFLTANEKAQVEKKLEELTTSSERHKIDVISTQE